MTYYLYQASYTAESWAAMVKNPQNRLDAVRPLIEELGGRIVEGYMAFGDSDAVIIAEMPDAQPAAALAIAASAGGGLTSIKTTILMTMDDAITAARQAGELNYVPPAAKEPALTT